MEIRTDRLGLLLDQFDTSLDIARSRMEGMTDEEYLWEPETGAWSLRHRSEARTKTPYGAGEWVMDWEEPEPEIVPVHTIAWRMGHLVNGFQGRWVWTWGERREQPEPTFSPHAEEALATLWAAAARWREGVASLTDEQMDMVGFGQYPAGLDPHIPFIGIVWWQNRELVHHTSELGLLRDLYRVRDRIVTP
jgi:hypothetical protein